MNRHYLIIGGSSAIAQNLLNMFQTSSGIAATVLSRSEINDINTDNGNITWFTYDPGNINIKDLPDIEMLNGLVYFPGTINLKPFHRLTKSDFEHDWHINFYGAVEIIQHYLPALKKAEQASIVLLSTVAVHTGMPFHSSISAAKGAVEGFTKALAAELAPRIRVNAIAPSMTRTNLSSKFVSSPDKEAASAKRHPLGRIGEPADIANSIKFLLSNDSSWITGQILHVDGGMSTLKLL